jgi:TetR/AcrR family transcriptional regulator, transcriptional repressor for nem operon
MARPRKFDEKKALNDALELFWEKGYEATSITNLTKRMGINRPSLYDTFGDKRGLFQSAINAYQQNYLDKLHNILETNGSGFGGIEAVFVRFVESANNPAAQRGCFFVNSIAELAANDEYMASKGREFQDKISGMFADALVNGMRVSEIPLNLDIQSTAHFLTMALVGLNVVVKTVPDVDFVRDSVRVVLNALK